MGQISVIYAGFAVEEGWNFEGSVLNMALFSKNSIQNMKIMEKL